MVNKSFIKYWSKQKKIIQWSKNPKITLKQNNDKSYSWYPDGKLNIYNNCIEKNLKNFGNKIAVHFVDKNKNISSLTYEQLFFAIENFSSFLKSIQKNKKSLKVAIHCSASPESVISMLSCAKLSHLFSVMFEDLPQDAIFTRLKIFKPDILISRADFKQIKNKIIPVIEKYNKNIKKKIKLINFSNFNKVVNYKKLVNVNTNEIITKKVYKELIKTKQVRGNTSSFILFTSGSTGLPKGVEHSTAGYLLYTKLTCKQQFGMNQNSVVMTASDAGWINGHTYALFGPLSFGATTVIVENPSSLMEFTFFKKIILDLEVSIIYLPVTIVRVMKAIFGNYKINSKKIKSIGSMGEILASNVSEWFSKMFSKNALTVVNTYFQTETGGIICSPRHNDKPSKIFHGTVGKPLCSHVKLNINKNFSKRKINQIELKILNPWPGCMKNIINGKVFFKRYWDKNNHFKLFDLGKINKNKNLIILGRSDDVMHVRGHRIGSGEIETYIMQIREIKEVCAISSEDEIEGSRVVIFYSLKKNNISQEVVKNKISGKILDYFGKWALPRYIINISEMPKTRSGKILRRVLRVLLNKEKNIGDISTMINPEIIYEIKKILQNIENK